MENRFFHSFSPSPDLSQKKPSSTQTSKPTKRIPEGVITGKIQLEAAKAYPTKIWLNTKTEPKIAYADRNSKGEDINLTVKLLPNGGKGAEHPQIVMFISGPYHTEKLWYSNTDPFQWSTWMELHLNMKNLNEMIDALYKAKFEMQKQTLGEK